MVPRGGVPWVGPHGWYLTAGVPRAGVPQLGSHGRGAYEGGVTSSPYVSVAPAEVVAVDLGVDGLVVIMYGKLSTGEVCNGCVIPTGPENGVAVDKAVAPFANVRERIV